MGDLHEAYFSECVSLAEAVRADTKLLNTAAEIMSLAVLNPHFHGRKLPQGTRHRGTGHRHSVIYLGTAGDQHVVLSLGIRKPYFIGDGKTTALEERISGFDYCSRRGKTTPLCVASIPLKGTHRLARLILSDATQGGALELHEEIDREYATILGPSGKYEVFIDPDGYGADTDVGKAYIEALHIMLPQHTRPD